MIERCQYATVYVGVPVGNGVFEGVSIETSVSCKLPRCPLGRWVETIKDRSSYVAANKALDAANRKILDDCLVLNPTKEPNV